jgi:hypothetical protein
MVGWSTTNQMLISPIFAAEKILKKGLLLDPH